MNTFHNWIKYQLIDFAYNNSPLDLREKKSLLDIGCGKGGDLQKWENYDYVVGVDSGSVGLQEANNRYHDRKKRKRKIAVVEFYKMNFAEKVNLDKGEFSVASCQMMIHYTFESKEAANQMLKNVWDNLVPGGIFIGTFADGDEIVKHLQGCTEISQPYNVGKYCTLQPHFNHDKVQAQGSKYDFTCKANNIERIPEYVTRFADLEILAKEVGFETLEGKENFESWYSRYRKMKNKKTLLLSPDEQKMSFLYSSFVFIKRPIESK